MSIDGHAITGDEAESFGAGASMAGYLWQVSHLIHRVLKHPGLTYSIEREDDLARIDGDNVPAVLEQLKHSQNAGTINENSRDWWSAIRVWAKGVASPSRLLVTTDELEEASLLMACYGPGKEPNFEGLCAAMNAKAEGNTAKTLESACEAWMKIPPEEREQFLQSIRISARAPRLNEFADQIDAALIDVRCVKPDELDIVRIHIQGELTELVTQSLDSSGALLQSSDVERAFQNGIALARQPGKYVLPSLQLNQADQAKIQQEQAAHLIPQVEAIQHPNPAIIAHALSKWAHAVVQREAVLKQRGTAGFDLWRFDKHLCSFAENLHLRHGLGDSDEHAAQIGREIHDSCMFMSPHDLGETRVDYDFTNGSFYELSNRLDVKWNPRYGDP